MMIQSGRPLSALGLAAGMAVFSFCATERAFSESEIKGGKAAITIKPHGGFVTISK